MQRVVIESPFRADTEEEQRRNVHYARLCCRDALLRYNEAPFASHLLYTQPGILDDSLPEERELGIMAGLLYVSDAELTAVYTDLGISPGMERGIRAAKQAGRQIVYRTLPVEVLSCL